MPLPLEIELNGNLKLEYNLIDKLLEGTENGDLQLEKESSPDTTKYCYLPLFRTDDWDQWYLGSYFLDKYAVVFDNSNSE
jgi:hypothetical protein